MTLLSSGQKIQVMAETTPAGRLRSVGGDSDFDSTAGGRPMLPMLETLEHGVVLDIQQLRVGVPFRFTLDGQKLMAIKAPSGAIEFYALGV
jgi:hypothetical protein